MQKFLFQFWSIMGVIYDITNSTYDDAENDGKEMKDQVR